MQTLKLQHYRNAIFQGELKNNKRNGKGILVTDKGEIVVGSWKNDKLYGNCFIYINPEEYAYCDFNRGELEGWARFQSSQKILIAQFNANHPINKQILINKAQHTYKIISPTQNAIYQTLLETQIPQSFQNNPSYIQEIAINNLNFKIPSYFNMDLFEYLQKELCKNNNFFDIEGLLNGQIIVKIRDQSSVVSVGFIISKANQLISYGTYVNNKLSGCGCRIQNLTRFEGIFQNGFLNGLGLKFNSGKYSFGVFENGALVNPTYFEQRSLASEQKLKQLKKQYHITNLNFSNQYIPVVLNFQGTKQVIFEIPLKQQYLFVQQILQKSSPPKKQNNLASKLLNRQELQTRSNLSISNRKANRNQEQQESRVIQMGKSASIASSSRFHRN